ncbi:MAG: hypothetical protein IAF02_28895 [Anaerolineae bacterium]|nr:hypothetical protein [Anaerolineae bacterium]
MNFFTQLTRPPNDSLACCNCRIVAQKSNQLAASHCPNCNRIMHNMGAGFIPPRHSDKDEWQKVAFLVKHNFSFEYLSA